MSMTNKQKLKVSEMITTEKRWIYDHPELNMPQWYLNLVIMAEQRLLLRDYAGAAHDIEQAIRGRCESMGICL